MLYSPAPRPCFSEVTIWKTQLERLRVSELTQDFHVRSEDAEKKAREAEHLETTLRVRRAIPAPVPVLASTEQTLGPPRLLC